MEEIRARVVVLVMLAEALVLPGTVHVPRALRLGWCRRELDALGSWLLHGVAQCRDRRRALVDRLAVVPCEPVAATALEERGMVRPRRLYVARICRECCDELGI